MADHRPDERALAVAVHEAEVAYGKANAAPAGPGRIERINRTADALAKAEDAYFHRLSGRAYPLR
jgi:hypothetical protein